MILYPVIDFQKFQYLCEIYICAKNMQYFVKNKSKFSESKITQKMFMIIADVKGYV